jgi:hypothetical protein
MLTMETLYVIPDKYIQRNYNCVSRCLTGRRLNHSSLEASNALSAPLWVSPYTDTQITHDECISLCGMRLDTSVCQDSWCIGSLIIPYLSLRYAKGLEFGIIATILSQSALAHQNGYSSMIYVDIDR